MQINQNQIDADKFEEVLAYYTERHDKVNVVECEECEATLCIEVLIPEQSLQAAAAHHESLSILPGDALLASRKRLDGVMGYQCKCGNDSRLSEPERGVVGNGLRDIMPHERDMVEASMRLSRHKPNVTAWHDDDGKLQRTIERFKVKQVK